MARKVDKQDDLKAFYQNDYIETGLIVVWDNGKPYRPNYISELFTKFIVDHNLPQVTLHGLRHTFAAIANLLGVPLFDIGKALGHSTPSTTGRIYTHLIDKTQREAFQRIADHLKNEEADNQ